MSKTKLSDKKVLAWGVPTVLVVLFLNIFLSVGYIVLIVFMGIWNITDIQNVGPNFWNIFWLSLSGLMTVWFVRTVFVRKK